MDKCLDLLSSSRCVSGWVDVIWSGVIASHIFEWRDETNNFRALSFCCAFDRPRFVRHIVVAAAVIIEVGVIKIQYSLPPYQPRRIHTVLFI